MDLQEINSIKERIEKGEELGLKSAYIYYLLNKLNDSEYTKECIEKADIIGLSSYHAYKLIKEMDDPEFIKSCIAKREKFEFNTFTIFLLIDKTKDLEYTKECIEKRNELNLEPKFVCQLIQKIEDQEYIKKCIEERDELELDSYHVYTLIDKIEDIQYLKQCIDKKEQLGLNAENIYGLIQKINEPEFTKECIERGKELGLSTERIFELIKQEKNAEYIKNYIERRKEFGFDAEAVYQLIKQIDEPEFIKKCIIKTKDLGLDYYVSDLIVGVKDINFANECIQKREEIGIKNSDLEILKIIYEDGYLDRLLKENNNSRVDLPPNMTIGIEIESIGKYPEMLNNLYETIFQNWKCTGDESIVPYIINEYGLEVVSPVLTGADEKTTKEINKVCTILNTFGNYANDTCGGHIHIGADYLTCVSAWQNMLELWANTEKIIYIICNEEGNIPRQGTNNFASPISADLEYALKTECINLSDESELEQFKDKLFAFQNKRFKGINFKNLINYEKNTIEFRVANGTVNKDTWIENINLFGGIVKTAQDLAIIQSKNEEELSQEEKDKMICFENIRSGIMDERKKLEEFLKLVIDESYQDIYLKRYDVNSRLLKENPQIENNLKEKTSKEPVKISKNKIGKKVFTGSDRMMDSDVKIAEQKINNDMKIEKLDRNDKFM